MARSQKAINNAIRKYEKAHTRKFCLNYNRRTDADIIEKLESVPSIMGYIRKLIQADIQAHKEYQEKHNEYLRQRYTMRQAVKESEIELNESISDTPQS